MNVPRSNTLQYGIGYFTFTACRFLRDMVFAKILGPVAFGTWAGLTIYRQYAAFGDLGFTNGLGRELPSNLGRNKVHEGRVAMGQAWSVSMVGMLICSVVSLLLFRWREQSPRPELLWGVGAVMILMFLDKHYMYAGVVLQSTRRVGEAGIWMGILAALELAVGVVLTRAFGLFGLYVSLIVSSLVVICIMTPRLSLRPVFKLELSSLRRLAVSSFVLMGFGLTNLALHNVDRVSILYYAGASAILGQYHVAATLSLIVGQLSVILLSVLVPEMYRTGSDNLPGLRSFLLLPTGVISSVSVVVAGLLWVALPFGLNVFLPQYQGIVPVARGLIVAELLFSISAVAGNLLVAMDRGHWGVLARVISVLIGLAGSFWSLSRGANALSVALSMCLAQGVGWMVIALISLRGLSIPITRYLLVSAGPVVYGGIVLIWSSHLLGVSSRSLPAVLAHLLVLLVAMAPLGAFALAFYSGRGPLASRRAIKFLYWCR